MRFDGTPEIRPFAKGERIQVKSALQGWQNATVLGYSEVSPTSKRFHGYQSFDPANNALLYVLIDGHEADWSCAQWPTISNFRELSQEALF